MRILIILSFLVLLNLSANNSQLIIAIQPYSGFDKNLVDTLSLAIKKIYGCNVKVLPDINLPKSAFTNIKSPRYRADNLINFLRKSKPFWAKCVIGLTDKDISVTKYDENGNIKKPKSTYEDWGIFGLGYYPGPSCVVSTFRLKKTTKENFILRYKKVCIHELGHNFGLDHCPTPRCVMSDANETIKTVDNELLELCDKCKKSLK
jgi:archaemetzincin